MESSLISLQSLVTEEGCIDFLDNNLQFQKPSIHILYLHTFSIISDNGVLTNLITVPCYRGQKRDFSSDNFDAFASASAYDTAWLAMIPHQDKQNAPMFETCLNWILQNQHEGGFWGVTDEEASPTIDTLPATLACILALRIWNAGHLHVELGLSFIHSEAAAALLKANCGNPPRWFVLTFPAMIELAEEAGLHLVLPRGLVSVIANMRQHILETEKVVETEASRYFPPLLSYLEALPSSYQFDRQQAVNRHLSSDGSLFQSPSATAQAFISTGNVHSLKYLQSLVQKFPNGVAAKYPVDGELIKLCTVDHLQGLGLAGYFNKEIDQLLAQLYRNIKNEKSNPGVIINSTIPLKLFKDALAFRLLRMHRYDVQPGWFCWFLHELETVSYMEENCEDFISAMYSVYRATDVSFLGENELEKARRFAKKLLENPNTCRHRDHILLITKGLQNMIKYELDTPWSGRLDRLYHRRWIEANQISPLWIGKASFYSLSCIDNKKLMRLAVENFEFQQSICRQELEEIKGWSKKWRLSEMGFARERTESIYFAMACCSCLPYNSIMRLVIAKAAIIVTVADDLYDTEGSFDELEILTHAVQRWDGEGLEGHSKTIFDALDDFVSDVIAKSHPQQGSNALSNLQHLWRETFTVWMVERRWSVKGLIPSMDEYLEMGVVSVAAHTEVLPATTFLNQNATTEPSAYHKITQLYMVIARLANDTRGYQREIEDGKMNLVSLHLRENPNASLEESVAHVTEILELRRKEFLQHVLADEDMSEPCKQIHLHCMKVFGMFYNSGDLFASKTALTDDVDRSIFLPIRRKTKLEACRGPSECHIGENSYKNILKK